MLAHRSHLQLDEPGRGREGYEVDGFAGPLGEILCDREDHAVVHVGGQDQLAIEDFLPPVVVGLAFHPVFPGGTLQRDLGILSEYRSALPQSVALQGKDALLSEDHRLVEDRPIFEAEHHTAFNHSTFRALEQITRRNGHAVDRAKYQESMGDTLHEPDRNRRCHGRARRQKHRHENYYA